jgi:hypothetical protein
MVKKLYHGSPYKLDVLEPRQAREKYLKQGRRNAVYMTDNPQQAVLYALARPRKGKRGSWATLDGKVHYLKGAPLNRYGYMYEADVDQYIPPPKGLEPIGYAVHKKIKKLKRKKVLLKGNEHRFIPYDTKAEYKKAVRSFMKKNRLIPT